MTDSDTAIEKLIEKIELYGKKSFELSKLKIIRHAIVLFTSLVSYSGIIIILFLFILMLSVSISFFIGELLGKLSYGFLIVSGFYMIVFIISYFFLHKWIKRPLANLIIKKIFKKT
jgi:hypothetical protein